MESVKVGFNWTFSSLCDESDSYCMEMEDVVAKASHLNGM